MKMECNDRPNALFKWKDWCAAFLASGALPGCNDVDEFEERYGFCHVWTGSKVPEIYGHRFAKNQNGFHVNGPAENVKNWLMVYDEMLEWRTTWSSKDNLS